MKTLCKLVGQFMGRDFYCAFFVDKNPIVLQTDVIRILGIHVISPENLWRKFPFKIGFGSAETYIPCFICLGIEVNNWALDFLYALKWANEFVFGFAFDLGLFNVNFMPDESCHFSSVFSQEDLAESYFQFFPLRS